MGRIGGWHYGEQSGTTRGIRRTPGKGGASPRGPMARQLLPPCLRISSDLLRARRLPGRGLLSAVPPLLLKLTSSEAHDLVGIQVWSSLIYVISETTASTTSKSQIPQHGLDGLSWSCSNLFSLLPRVHWHLRVFTYNSSTCPTFKPSYMLSLHLEATPHISPDYTFQYKLRYHLYQKDRTPQLELGIFFSLFS